MRERQTGRRERLLVGCLTELVKKNQTQRGSDQKIFEDIFQEHRQAFIELFPETGESGLARLGVPKSTLRVS